MADHPVEKDLYDFLEERIAAIPEDDPLLVGLDSNGDEATFEIDLHRHPYQKFDAENKWFGIRIGNCASDLAPNSGATEMVEFDADVFVVTFARLREPDKSDLEVAVAKAFALANWVAGLFCLGDDANGVTLGERVNDARVADKCRRNFDEWDGSLYAVCGLPMLINDTGGGR